MFGIGSQELLFIFLIVLLVFGGKKIPEIARGLGKGIREFKNAKDGIEEDIAADAKVVPAPAIARLPKASADDKQV